MWPHLVTRFIATYVLNLSDYSDMNYPLWYKNSMFLCGEWTDKLISHRCAGLMIMSDARSRLKRIYTEMTDFMPTSPTCSELKHDVATSRCYRCYALILQWFFISNSSKHMSLQCKWGEIHVHPPLLGIVYITGWDKIHHINKCVWTRHDPFCTRIGISYQVSQMYILYWIS